MKNSVITTQLPQDRDSLRPDPQRAWSEIDLIRQLHTTIEAIPPENRHRVKLKISVGDLSRLLYTVIGYTQFDLSGILMNSAADEFIRQVKAAHPDLTLQAGIMPPDVAATIPFISGLATQGSIRPQDPPADPHHIENLLRNTDVKPGAISDVAAPDNQLPQVLSWFDLHSTNTVMVVDGRFQEFGTSYSRFGLSNLRVINTMFDVQTWDAGRHCFRDEDVTYCYDQLIAQLILNDLSLITREELTFMANWLKQPLFAHAHFETLEGAYLYDFYARVWTKHQLKPKGPRVTSCRLIEGPHPVRQTYVLMRFTR